MTPAPDRLLLILDLDETLLHSSSERLGRAEDFQLFDYFVYVRPHLEPFLAQCAERFRLAVGSSASDDYVAEIVKRLFPPPLGLEFAWGRSRCTFALDTARGRAQRAAAREAALALGGGAPAARPRRLNPRTL